MLLTPGLKYDPDRRTALTLLDYRVAWPSTADDTNHAVERVDRAPGPL